MFNNTQYKVREILGLLGGLPEECDWIDYKALRSKMTSEYMGKIKNLVVSFLNSIREFDKDKYIIFGIEEDKKTKKKLFSGIKGNDFPDDNEWQNLFESIMPNHPYVETGTFNAKGLIFAYIYISAQNYKVPYSCNKKGVETFYIRRGGNKYESMTSEEKQELEEKKTEINKFGKVYPKSDILNKLVILGKYNESSKSDVKFIEAITGRTYEEIKYHCLLLDNSFSDKEKSIYGFGCSETVEIQNKKERLLQFIPDELIMAKDVILNVFRSEDYYSEELLSGVADTLVFLKNNGFIFIAESIIKSAINFDLIKDSRYRNIFQSITEASPAYMLNLIVQHKNEILEHRIEKMIIEILRVIAWFPEHYIEAVRLLLEFGDSSIHELFTTTETATAANFEQKKELIQEIASKDKNIAFEILNKILYFNPKSPSIFLSHNYTPEKYIRLFNSSHNLDFIKLQEYYTLMIECAENCVGRLLKLLPQWLQPFPFSNLNSFIEHLEKVESKIQSIDERQKLWNRLCNTPLIYITDFPLEDSLKHRFISVGNKFKPDDIYKQHQQWFREGVINDLCLDGTKYEDSRMKVFEMQKNILLGIYKKNGISEMNAFIQMVNMDPFKFMQMLVSKEFSLSIEDDNILVSTFFEYPKTYTNYLRHKSFCEKTEWVKRLKIENLDSKDKTKLFSALYPSIENIKYFEEVLGDEIKIYWEYFEFEELGDTDTLQYVFNKLIDFGVPQKAFNLINAFQNSMKQLSPQWIFDALIIIEKYPECSFLIDRYATIYSYMNGKIDDNRLERLEHLSFRLYGKISYNNYNDFKPHVTFKKIVNESEFFVEIVKNIMDNPMGVCNHLLIHCDDEPDMPCDWVTSINNLVTDEPEEFKIKIDYWIGHILYNTIKHVNNNYEIEDSIACLLEKSNNMRRGFFIHAYYTNGYHINGSYEEDSKDRINAEKFRNMADVQVKEGNTEFGNILKNLADNFINSVELKI